MPLLMVWAVIIAVVRTMDETAHIHLETHILEDKLVDIFLCFDSLQETVQLSFPCAEFERCE